MKLRWNLGNNIMGIKKTVFVALVSIFCVGCGNDGKNEINSTEQAEILEYDTCTQEIEDDVTADTYGWEYQGDEEQYIWGIWTVTGMWESGNGWSEEDNWVGGTYELLPGSWHYKDQTSTCSAKLTGYYVSPRASSYFKHYNYEYDVDYCLEIEDIQGEYLLSNDDALFSSLFLVDEKEMLATSGRTLFRLNKTEDFDEIAAENSFVNPGYGIWHGEWEVTKVLKENNENASQYVGESLKLESWDIEQYCSRFYFVEAEEKSIGKLVEMMGLGENQHFVAFYEMSDDFYWDKIIIKDEMTIILVKDGNYFEAKRISEKDEYGEYGNI